MALINSTLAIAVPPQLSISDASLTEGNSGTTDAVFTVSLSAPAPTGGVRFDLATANGTATAGSDYTATSTTGVTIPAGQSTATFTVPVNGDTTWEPDETFFVDVTNPVGVVLQDGQGQGTIRNDDTPPSDFAVITTATSIVITDATANGSTLQASEPVAGTVRFEAPGRTFSVDGGPVINGNSGNLPLTGITAIAVNAAGGTTVASGTTLNLATASYSSASALRLAGGTLRSTGTVTVAAPVVLTADSDVAAASSQALVLSGPISGDFTLRTFGAGVHRFSGVGSNFSRLNIASGAVALGATDGLPAQVDIVNSGAFDLAGFNQSIDFYAGAGATQNTGAAATLTIGTAGSTSSFGGANYVGAISGPINLVVAAGANQRLGSNSSSYTGTTTVQGTVIVTGTRALGATGPGNGTTLSSGGRIDLNNVAYAEPETLTIQGGQMFANSGSSSFPGAISVDSSGTAFIVLGTALTLDGVISGTGAVQTQGLLTLTQANMLTGPITAGLGTLLVTGSTPAASTVTSLAATLGGTGQIGGPTSVTGAGALAPGLVGGVGTLRTGNLSLAGVARAEFDINGVTPGTQHDQADVTGTVSLGGATLVLSGSYVPTVGQTFVLIRNDGADAVSGTFAGLAEGAILSFNGMPLQVSYTGGDGNDVVLSALPDPAARIAVVPASVPEDGAGTLVYTVSLSRSVPTPTTVALTVGGTATSGSDYTGGEMSVTVPANATSASVTIDPTLDRVIEPDETVILTVVAGPGYTLGESLVATGTITNDDNAGVTVAATGGSTAVSEGGETDTYTLVLTSQPTADVTVAINPNAQLTTSPNSVVFTAANWNMPETVTVTAVDDAIAEGSHNGSVSHAVTSSDSAYNDLTVDVLTATITDNDTAGISVTPTSGLTTTEAGGTAAFTVVLSSQPTSEVSIGLSSSDTTEGTVSPTTLNFTPANWNQVQTVTVTGVDDPSVDGNVAYSIVTSAATSGDSAYNGTNPSDVGVSNSDNDVAGVTVTQSAGGTALTEDGATDTYTLVLTSQPATNVTVVIAADAQLSAAPAPVVFTPATWDRPQMVTLTAVDDAVAEGSHIGSISHSVTSTDTDYNSLNVSGVTATIADNDIAGFTVTPTSGLITTEAGGTADFTVRLTSQPTANVILGVSSNDASEGTAAPATLTFTSGNWNQTQTVTVTGVDDAIDEGDIAYVILTAAATSSDPNYAGLNPADVAVSNADDDSAGLIVLQTGGTAVTEGGTADTYDLLLASEPTANVTVTLNAEAGIGVSPGSLVFSPSNWNQAQTVTVTATDDNLVEGPNSALISHTLGSTDPAYGSLPGTQITVAITDNDSAVVSFASTSVSQLEAMSPMVFTVTLSNPVASGVTLTVNSSSGTAISPSDFTAISGGTVSFAPNSTTSQTVNVAIANDSLFEGNDTYTLALSNLVATGNVTLPPGTASATGTITNDDDAPTITISAPTVVEGNPPTDPALNFEVSLSAASGLPVNFSYATNGPAGTATAGADYTAIAGSVGTIGAGGLSVTLPVNVLSDTISEGNETVVLALSGISNANVTSLSGTGTINDDDIAGITINDVSLTEGDSGSQSLQFTVNRSGNGGAFSVDYATGSSGSATAGSDYTSTTGTLSFTANGAPSQVINVPITGESLVEASETFTVTLSNVVNTLGTAAIDDGSGTGTITDNDSATVQFNPVTLSQSEATSPMAFAVTLSNPVQSGVALTVNSTPGTATSPSDFTAISGGTVSFAPNSNVAQTVNVVIANDGLFEGNETYTLALSSLVATGNVTLPPGTATATGTITNDDDAPTITISAPSVTEGNPPANSPLNFVVSLNTASGLPVNFSYATNGAAGTATAGTDYSAVVSAAGSIAAGQLSVTLPVTVISDLQSEANETVVLDLSAISNANVTSLSGTGTINDDDVAQITITDAGLTEGDSGSQNLQFTVSRSGNGGAFSVDFATSNATATAGSDYTSTTGTLSFTANGAPSQVINVPITGESLVEVAETFTVTLSNVVNTVGTAAIDDSSGTGTITDNDSATVQFNPVTLSQSEATSPMAFTVTLSNPVQSGVTLTVNSTPGTATSPADFAATSGSTVSFAPNSDVAQTVDVVIANDALDEDDEQFTLTLSGLTAIGSVTLPIATATATGIIQDDDALPVLSVADLSQTEGNSGTTTMTFTVNLTPVSGRAVSFNRATADGSAVSTGAAPDFVALTAAPVTIAAGQTSASIAVTINGDPDFEGDQQFALELSAVGNATPGSLNATGTIVDDDQQPTTTTISSDQPDPSLVGQPYTVEVVVRGQTSSPSGTVAMSDGSASCGPATLSPGNSPESTASCQLISSSAGTRTLTASYTPSTSAFAPSSGTTTHRVDPASTRLSVAGPARVRINTAATYSIDLSAIAPGGGTPTGTVTVTSGANSCTIALPATSCDLSFSALGSRTISASYPGNSDYLGSNSSGGGNANTVVFALSDVQVTKTDGREFYAPGDLIVYTIQVRNLGPDTAENIGLQDSLPEGLSAGQWSCDASGGAICAQNAGTGNLDQLIPILPRSGLLNYTLFANVIGSPRSISNTASLVLPADATIDDPQSANNSATDVSILDRLFDNGFEAPTVNGPNGSFVLPGLALRSALDSVAMPVFSLVDVRGTALRVYARSWNGEVEYALAIREGDGKLRLGAWRRHVGEPTLRWTATQTGDGWVLQSAALL